MYSTYHIKIPLHSPLLIKMAFTFIKDSQFPFIFLSITLQLRQLFRFLDFYAQLCIQHFHVDVSYRNLKLNMLCTRFIIISLKLVFLQGLLSQRMEQPRSTSKKPVSRSRCLYLLCLFWSTFVGSFSFEFMLEVFRDLSVGHLLLLYSLSC